ncbi:chloroplast stem-loop-binding protein [Chloropicon primus]|uniref:Chloroplast stem-loop-binding protein n=1 Tax=Chloropicon primus TaxID=1764295 RepID=A0A5B8MQ33_9CHLO|nr:chloroplast stem-loop-binding protein [Chloropicon primus]|eukprot:QDZ22629.1 chloroplast stem-loop-binding protein [Chloropicon primus]
MSALVTRSCATSKVGGARRATNPLCLPSVVLGSRTASLRRQHQQQKHDVRANASVFVVNTPGGGHAVIGFHLAKQLAEQNHDVTIMVPGDEGSDKMNKEPFSRFDELRSMGVKTVWGSTSDCGACASGSYDVVVDNNGKDLDTCQPVIDWAVGQGAKQFLYVSSAGIYKPSVTPPHVEGDPVKESASHVSVENYLRSASVEESIFRPQYITGDANNKDCEEWFFDRIARGRPVPIPGDGMATTNVAQVEDMAKMMTLAVENDQAHGGLFNCVGDRGVTLNGLVELAAEAAGVNMADVKIINYDPEEVGVEGKKAFPFRYTYHFFSEPRAAVAKLGMTYERTLGDALKERWAAYKASGRAEKDMSFEMDDKIISAMTEKVAA